MTPALVRLHGRFAGMTALALAPAAAAISVALFSKADSEAGDERKWLWFALAALVLAGLVLWYWVRSTLSDPIDRITSYVKNPADGEAFSAEAEAFIVPELRQIAGAIARPPVPAELSAADLQSVIEQRDAALREMFHRVRNNLQLTSSFVGLQWRQARDEAARLSLGKSKAYLTFMAAAHQALYVSGDLTRVSIGLLAEQYGEVVTSAFDQISALAIDTTRVSGKEIASDRAVPLSLCLCEGLSSCVQTLGPDRTFTAALEVSAANGEYIWRVTIVPDVAQGDPVPAPVAAMVRAPVADMLMPSFIAQLQGRVTAWPEMSGQVAVFEIRFPEG